MKKKEKQRQRQTQEKIIKRKIIINNYNGSDFLTCYLWSSAMAPIYPPLETER